jgi:hypothetical protein
MRMGQIMHFRLHISDFTLQIAHFTLHISHFTLRMAISGEHGSSGEIDAVPGRQSENGLDMVRNLQSAM